MEQLGYRNVGLVYERAEEGRLLTKREDGVWALDLFPLTILTYMALRTYDFPKDKDQSPYVPSRYYSMGWRNIAEDLGLLRYDGTMGKRYGYETMGKKRENTARTRISRAWVYLMKHGLIKRLVPASLGHTAGYLLLLGDDDENVQAEADAREILGID